LVPRSHNLREGVKFHSPKRDSRVQAANVQELGAVGYLQNALVRHQRRGKLIKLIGTQTDDAPTDISHACLRCVSFMQKLMWALLIASFAAGCSKSREDYAPLAEFVANAEKVTLYEGLPHQYAEKKLLAEELAKKDTIRIGDFDFYKEPIPLSNDDAAAFTEIFDGTDAFSETPAGETKCGPYHPDFCLEWSKGDDQVRVQVCLSCGESEVHSGVRMLYLKIGSDAGGEITRLLKDRWQNRPRTRIAEDARD
jgi:hypothetical protein